MPPSAACAIALGDSAENPRFIEPGAPRLSAAGTGNGTATTDNRTWLLTPSAPLWWGHCGIIAVLVASLWAGMRATTHPRPRVISERRLTANASENPVTDGVISPDENTLPSGFRSFLPPANRHRRDSRHHLAERIQREAEKLVS